jgi:predicted HTH transcriptional regulator
MSFQAMDSIATAVSDSCEPQIIPEIEPYTVDSKTIIVVTVSPGPQRPYYLKSKGKEKSTYIRVGATTRPASLEKIKELEMEGAKISWDELTCVGYKVTESAIKKLCRDMNARRKEMRQSRHPGSKLSPGHSALFLKEPTVRFFWINGSIPDLSTNKLMRL